MAADTEQLSLEIATPIGLALATECDSISAPSVDGEFGVFPGHLPLLAALRSGVIKYSVDGEDRVAAVGPGFVEAGPERVLLLTDSFAVPDDIDAAEVEEELSEAEARLEQFDGDFGGSDHGEIVRDVEWARARLALLGD